MSDDIYTDDQDPQQTEGSRLRQMYEAEKAKAAQLAVENEALTKLKAENEALARKVAFTEAGLPNTPQVEFFKSHYTGDPTPEAVKTAATAAGFLDTNIPASETKTYGLITETVTGASSATIPGTNQAVRDDLAKVHTSPNSADEIGRILKRHGVKIASDFE